jgi:dTDP-4-dehydrorhamnose 3,5-epimerase
LLLEHDITVDFVQDNYSRSKKGTLRGLHYQLERGQDKLVLVGRGRVLDVAVDVRVGSPTFGKSVSVELSDKNHQMLFIPKGFAHGFCVMSNEADFLYKCSEYYHPESERGVYWNDPDLQIEWPELNSDYIFNLPFDSENKSINLDEVTPGLEQLCNKYKIDKKLKEKVYELKEVYWRDTKTLIHGDYYPRSWLKTPKGLFVIDPEFAFYGQPEFDLSVFISHMEMSSQGKKVFDALKENYGSFNESQTLKLAAVEIFRRIMFVSQLPLVNDLALKSSLLERSYRTIMGDDPFIFFGENQ